MNMIKGKEWIREMYREQESEIGTIKSGGGTGEVCVCDEPA